MTVDATIAALAVALILLTTCSASVQLDDPRAQFEAFKQRFNKVYASAEEEALRFQHFQDNLERAAQLAIENPLATFGPNAFADISEEEFKIRHNSQRAISSGVASAVHHSKIAAGYQPTKANTKRLNSMGGLPMDVDWRKKGAVTPVKNQGQCGSCWSFSTTGSIEGQWMLAGNPLTSLSEQELVSCDHLFAFGCHGSFSLLAYTWLLDTTNGTIATDASYPYVSGNGSVPKCTSKKQNPRAVGAQITGGKLLLPWAPQEMMAFVAVEGPLSVAVDASSFQTYTGGIMTSCKTFIPDHEVLIVGYGRSKMNTAGTNGTTLDYWIVKNSWGTGWGEDGYIRVELGKNLCQIELLPNSAEVSATPHSSLT